MKQDILNCNNILQYSCILFLKAEISHTGRGTSLLVNKGISSSDWLDVDRQLFAHSFSLSNRV